MKHERSAGIGLLAVFSIFLAGCTGTRVPATAGPNLVNVSPAGANAAEPAVAAAPDGGSYVVYVEHQANSDADVYLQKLDETGASAANRVRVNEKPGSAKAWRGDPPTIAVAGDGAIFIGWTRRYEDPKAKGNDLVLSVSRDGGKTFAPAVKVNDDTLPASHGMHSLAITQDGRTVMAWLDERNIKETPHDMSKMSSTSHHEAAEPNSEVFAAVSQDGGKTFSANQKLASEVCPCCKTTLLAAADGTIYAAWRQVLEGDHRHIALASSKDGGATFSQPAMVSNDKWQIHACPVSGAALSSAGKDEIEIAWYTEGSAGPAGLYYSRSGDGGKTFSERKLISENAKAGTPTLMRSNGGLMAVFSDKDGNSRVARLNGQPHGESNLPNASVAAAAFTNNGPIVVFSRVENNVSSIWLSRG